MEEFSWSLKGLTLNQCVEKVLSLPEGARDISATEFKQLQKHAEGCDHITEFGTRWGISTIALLSGRPKKLVTYDLMPFPSHDELKEVAEAEGIELEIRYQDCNEAKIEETDFLFIDAFHSFDDVMRQLAKHNKVRKTIALHDTETCKWRDQNLNEKAADTLRSMGRNVGIYPAIKIFKDQCPWVTGVILTETNGMTFLKRAPQGTETGAGMPSLPSRPAPVSA